MNIIDASSKPIRFRHPNMRAGIYYKTVGERLVRSTDFSAIETPINISLADLQAQDYEFEAAEKEEVKLSREKLAEVARSLKLSADQENTIASAMGFQGVE